MPQHALESDLLAALLLEAPRAFPELRLFRRNVSKVKILDPRTGRSRSMRFALPGQCDLWGVLVGGIHIEIELKSATGSLEPDQRVWRDFCAEWCIPYALLKARADESIPQTIARWLVELRATIPV
jgi:hypothetical protein